MKVSTGTILLAPFFFLGNAAEASTCPTEQKPCAKLSNGRVGYTVNKINTADGTCDEVCTTEVASKLDQGYECGNCLNSLNGRRTESTSDALPSCPDQDPCDMFGDEYPGYSVSKVDPEDGTCTEYCAAGGSLTSLLDNDGYECGSCICRGQKACSEFGDGVFGYYIHQNVGVAGLCKELCAPTTVVTKLLKKGKFECGQCP